MKYLSVFLIFFSLASFAQPDGWVQTDVGQGHVVMCKQKKKVGIWSNARGEFLDPPHKGHLLHLSDPQLILDVYPKDKKVKVYHYYKGGVQLLEAENDSGYFKLGHIKGSEWDKKLQFEAIETKFQKHYHEDAILLSIDKDRKNYDWDSKFDFHFVDDFLKINFVHTNSTDPELKAIPSIEFPGMDSINNAGEVVYYPPDEKLIFNSGLFNIKTGKWDIPANYQGVNEWKGIYGAFVWPDSTYKPKYAGGGMVYDFYKYNKKTGLNPTEFMNYQGYGFPLDLWPVEEEQVWYDKDSIYIYNKGKKGVGLYKIPMGKKSVFDGKYSREHGYIEGHFEVKQIFEPRYQYVFRNGSVDYRKSLMEPYEYYAFASIDDSTFDMVFSSMNRIEHGRKADTIIENVTMHNSIQLIELEIWLNDTSKYGKENAALIDGDSIIRYNPLLEEIPLRGNAVIRDDMVNVKHANSTYKTQLLDNGTLVVNSYKSEEYGRERVAIRSNVDALMDSITEDGYVLYYPIPPGIYHSGIYDPMGHKWIIQPENLEVYFTNNAYAVMAPVYYGDYYGLDSTVVYIQDKNGKSIIKPTGWDAFNQPEYLKYRVPGYTVKSVQPVSNDPDNFYTFYFTTEEGTGVASIDGKFPATILMEPSDMVSHSVGTGTFYYKDGELGFRLDDAKKPNGEKVEEIFPLDSNGAVIQVHGGRGAYKLKNNDYNKPANVKSRNDIDYYNYNGIVKKLGEGDICYYYVSEDSSAAVYHYALNKPGAFYDSLRLNPKDTLNLFIKKDFKASDSYRSDKYDDYYTCQDYKEFDMHILNEDLVYIKNVMEDDEEMVPLLSEIDYYDSIDAEGYIVYYQNYGGYSHSGVYSTKNQEWVIAPKYWSVEWISGEHFFLQETKRDEHFMNIGAKYYLKTKNKELLLHETISKPKKGPYYDFNNNQTPEEFYESNKPKGEQVVDFGKISDSLVYINKYTTQVVRLSPVKSYWDPLMDSIDVDGNIPYYPRQPGVYESGVYNVYTDEWIVPAKQAKIYLLEDGFIVAVPKYTDEGMLLELWFDIYDISGNKVNEKPLYSENMEHDYPDLINLSEFFQE